MGYSIEREDFVSVQEDWLRLLPLCTIDTIFITPQWQRLWWQEFANGKVLSLLAIKNGFQLVGIAPLMRQGKVISLIGGPEVCDYLDFIVARGEEAGVYRSLVDFLDSLDWEVIDLHCLPPSSPTLHHLTSLAKERNYAVEITEENVCPKVELPSTWDDYLQALTKKDRHELRRKMRRLSSAGEVRYYVIESGSLCSGDIDDFIQLHKKSRLDKAEFMSPKMVQFFQALSASLAQQGLLKLFFLELNGVRVASSLCFDYKDEFLLYNSGYDPAYSSLSVGLLLKAFCLQEAISLGKKRFDFLRGAESYKYHLGGKDEPIYRCVIEKGSK